MNRRIITRPYAFGIFSALPELDLDGNASEDASTSGKVADLYARDGNLLVSESGGLGILAA